ncbi:MAG TPA: alpha-2-macroglobulin family protein [Candidatus Angelobacter sp.]|jgi:hypothetical protein|nr:alpha-2-macroglobulin family protein [Candidatus Angelobacter sp.]
MGIQPAGWLWTLALAVVVVSPAQVPDKFTPVSVVESRARFDYQPAVRFVLPLSNSSGKQLRCNLEMQFLDAENKVAAAGTSEITLDPGNFLNNLLLGEKALPTNSPSALATYRLKFTVQPIGPPAYAAVTGTIQLRNILTDPFQIRTSSMNQVRAGTKYSVRVLVENPYTGAPYAGTGVSSSLKLQPVDSGDGEDKTKPVVHNAKTDGEGHALFVFDLPSGHKYSGGVVTVSARRGVLIEEQEIGFKYPAGPRFALTTDKPIYQPGQTVHMRVQAFGPDNSALPGGEVELTITDPEHLNAFRKKLATSKFGIASADWEVPSNLRLGDFNINASLSSGDWYESGEAQQTIKVSRYDLPSFSVEASPDRPYYLKGQNPRVKVTARYLFGEMVKQGHVRIVRVSNRTWDYSTQRYDTNEDEVATGELKADGTFTAEVPFESNFEQFSEDRNLKYEDLEFAAYVTDASTQRTEQRRFDVRMTHQPIHIFMKPVVPLHGTAPPELYLTTYYADGTPASVELSVAALKPNSRGTFEEDAAHPLESVSLRKTKTNSYGVVKITGLEIPKDCLGSHLLINDYGSAGAMYETRDAYLRFEAHDGKGLSGTESDSIGFEQTDYVHLRPGKTLYREGDDIPVDIDVNTKVDELAVEVIGESEALMSKSVHLTGGHGKVIFPYDRRFQGELRIVANSMTTKPDSTSPQAFARVLYPAKQELVLATHLEKSSYKPGEQAVVDFNITTAQGVPVQGALGTVVFDKAVSERVRTDRDFGGQGLGFRNYDWYQWSTLTIGGLSIKDLLAWDNSRPFPDGLDLVAEALVNDGYAEPHDGRREDHIEIRGGENYFADLSATFFEKIIKQSVADTVRALDASYKKTGKYPYSLAELKSTLKDNDIDFDAVRDPWDMPYEVSFSSTQNQDVLELKTMGPDKLPNTKDDFTAATIARPNYLTLILGDSYVKTEDYPHNLVELKATFKEKGIDFDALRDPWGTPYAAIFSVEGQYDVLRIESAGPDRERNTGDDFSVATTARPYFGKTCHAIERARQNYFTQTGKYVRDHETLRDLLRKEQIDLDALRDPWGNKYRYDHMVQQNYFVVMVTSAGPDGIFGTEKRPSPDDVNVCNSRMQYFQRESAALDAALAEHFRKTGVFPATTEQLLPVLDAAKLSAEELKDPWGTPYHFTFNEGAFYANSVGIKSYSVYPDRPHRVTTATPVTQHVAYVHVMSDGPITNRYGFSVADFSGVLTEQTGRDLAPVPTPESTSLTSGEGGIKGQVTDPSGAAVRGVMVKARGPGKRPSDEASFYGTSFYEATTGADGAYTVRNMPPGLYEVHFTRAGFTESIVARVPVHSSDVTNLDVALNVAPSQQVADAIPTFLIQQNIGTRGGCPTCSTIEVAAPSPSSPSVGHPIQGFTPRLRQYFPETLLWDPETVTDSRGHAQLRFRLADNITTWSISMVASTLDGKTGTVQKDLLAFQPFFVEHDPPKVLTQGDVISLPVVLRNYSKEPLAMSVQMATERWFSLLAPPLQNITVPTGGSAEAVFPFRVDASTKDSKQRVTASNGKSGDSIERTVDVHPDGEEILKYSTDVLGGSQSEIEFATSEHSVQGPSGVLIKLYPNLMSHLVESAQAMANWPNACAEQTASVMLVNLRTLRILKKVGQDDPNGPQNPNAAIARRAREYIQQDYLRLLAYRGPDGGYSYWGRGPSDLAVTANVLRVLLDAKSVIDVDESAINNARDFIVKQQQPDGSWASRYWQDDKPHADTTLTAYLARVLATAEAGPSNPAHSSIGPATEKAMHYLEDKIDEWKEPYLIANYALAAMATGRTNYQAKARQRLLSMAHDEGPVTYWNVELNTTPFYGWGHTGNLETTALAVEALSLLPASADVDGQSARQARRGLLFLLQGKDHDGAWPSTAATVNVVDAIIAAMPTGNIPGGPSMATVWLNGVQAASVRVPGPAEITGPVVVPLPHSIRTGANKVEVRRPNDTSALMAQVVSVEYIPWEYSVATKDSNLKLGETRALRLGLNFDHTKAKVGEAVRCTVKAERIGFQGYGMMLAQIGLPPGVDVDRASLDAAIQDHSYEVAHYDLLPEHIVFYLWPRAGGVEFNFTFRPRFRMDASTAPSLLFDYYNPEARSMVRPVKFIVN